MLLFGERRGLVAEVMRLVGARVVVAVPYRFGAEGAGRAENARAEQGGNRGGKTEVEPAVGGLGGPSGACAVLVGALGRSGLARRAPLGHDALREVLGECALGFWIQTEIS